MRLHLFLLVLILISTGDVYPQTQIKNATVIDVEKKKMLFGYDVVTLDGKIISVDKGKKYKLPAGTEVIDGTGKFLVPGFTDAHVHFFQSGGLYARPDAIDLRKYQPYEKEIEWVHHNMEDFLRRYTSAGITSVIDVGATYNFLAQRDTFENKLWAPHLTMAGPLLTTWVPEVYRNSGDDSPFVEMTTEENIRKAVRDQLARKADLIKIWYIVTDTNIERGAAKNLPLVRAAIDEAHKHKLRIAVHATERITAQLAVEAGADFLVHNIDDEIVNSGFLELLKSRNTVICPTIVVAGNYGKVLSDRYPFSTSELALANPVTAATIIDFPRPDTTLGDRYTRLFMRPDMVKRQAHTDSIAAINLKKMLDAGIIIATGTDAGNIGTQHASSYFTELAAMQQAGFNTWQLLQSSTINGAKAAGRQNESGSIATGKDANMVLLDANPLDSLANWQKVNLVINKGKAWKPDSLILATPVSLAQQQLNAYNAHDLEAFLAPYSENVEVYGFPDKLQIKGIDEMRKAYAFIEKTPKLYCRLLNRIVQGNIVVDHEEVWGFGDKPFYGLAIYVVEKGKITKVYFPN